MGSCLGLDGSHSMKRLQKGNRKLLAMMDVFIILIVLMFSQVYTYVKTHQIILFKYVHFIIFQLYSNVAVCFFLKCQKVQFVLS